MLVVSQCLCVKVLLDNCTQATWRRYARTTNAGDISPTSHKSDCQAVTVFTHTHTDGEDSPGSRGVPCPPASGGPVQYSSIYLLAWTVSLNRMARSYGALQALSAVISRFTSDFQSQARIVGWEAIIKKPLHAHISYTSLSYVSRC